MDSILTTGCLPGAGSFAVPELAAPNPAWTAPGGVRVAVPATWGGLSVAALAGHPGYHIRTRNLVKSITIPLFADRMRVSAFEP